MLFLAAIIPAVAAVSYEADVQYEHERSTAIADIRARVGTLARHDGFLLGETKSLLEGLSRQSDVRRYAENAGGCARAAERAMRDNLRYAFVGVVTMNGDVACAGTPLSRPANVRNRSWFSRVVEQKDLTVGAYTYSIATGVPATDLAYPLFDDNGQMIGAVVVALRLDWLNHRLSELALERGTIVAILDPSGILVARYPEPDKYIGRRVTPGWEDAIRHGAATREQVALDGVPRLFAYAPLSELMPDGLVVTLGIDQAALLSRGRWNLLFDLIVLAGICVLGAGLAMIGGHWLIVRPLASLARAAAEIAAGNHAARAPELSQSAEIVAVGRAFNQMASTLERNEHDLHAAHDFKTRLLAIAGHDLRQPLQVITMSLQKLARYAKDEGTQKWIGHATRGADNLAAQLDTILNMSQLGIQATAPRFRAIPLAPLFAEIADEIEPAARARDLDLRVRATQLVGWSDREMLATILRNLVGNAVKYTQAGGVLLACRRHEGEAWIEIYDTGVGIPHDKVDIIFSAFYRIDATHGAGLGLGLAIAKGTADVLGHRLVVSSRVGHGTRFRIALSLADEAVQAAA